MCGCHRRGRCGRRIVTVTVVLAVLIIIVLALVVIALFIVTRAGSSYRRGSLGSGGECSRKVGRIALGQASCGERLVFLNSKRQYKYAD